MNPGHPPRPVSPGTGLPDGIGGEKVKRDRRELFALPRPRNTAELEAMSSWYFGKPLHLSRLCVYSGGASYEVAEPYGAYHGTGWLFGSHCTVGYDYSRDFWRHVIGDLSCGGIAGHSYGQVKVIGYREHKRLEALRNSWARKDAGRVRKSLARLAPNGGGGENTAILGSGRVLTSDREDGALAASRGTVTA